MNRLYERIEINYDGKICFISQCISYKDKFFVCLALKDSRFLFEGNLLCVDESFRVLHVFRYVCFSLSIEADLLIVNTQEGYLVKYDVETYKELSFVYTK